MTGSEAESRLRAYAAQGRQRLALFTDDDARRNFFGLPMVRASIEARDR
jgi:hypothetical protein